VDREIDQLACGVLVGEVALGLQRLAELAVERFEREERGDVFPGVQPGLGDDREPLPPLLVERFERRVGGVGVQRGVDRFEVSCDLLALPPGHVFEAVANQMNVMPISA